MANSARANCRDECRNRRQAMAVREGEDEEGTIIQALG
jgi:hypothetical protein